MKRAIYPGSFDPVTVGHLDIISRSAQIFDEVIVGVLNNNQKAPLFCAKERVALIEEVTKELKNVRAEAFSGLLVDFARKEKATTIIRGLRADEPADLSRGGHAVFNCQCGIFLCQFQYR